MQLDSMEIDKRVVYVTSIRLSTQLCRYMGKVEAGFSFRSPIDKNVEEMERNVEQSKSIRLAFSPTHCAPGRLFDVTHFSLSRHE